VIVADAGLIAAFAIRSEHSARAEAVCTADPEWAAPVLWRSEFCSLLAGCLGQRMLDLETALLSLRAAQEIVGGREYAVAPEQVLALAESSGCPAYQCEYVALALDLGVPLVTADRTLLRAFPKTAVALETFAGQKKR
jgi:predicted nucleic acid-binding protein